MTRRRHIGIGRWVRLVGSLLVLAVGLHAATAGDAAPRGGRVAWGRLMTGGDWSIHSDRDPDLASFIEKQTTLNIDPTWYSVDPSVLGDLCRHPLIYAKNISRLRSAAQLDNIREYLSRGGFLCIDPCTTRMTAGALNAFLAANYAILRQALPDAQLRPLPESHSIYHCYFSVKKADLFTPDMGLAIPDDFKGLMGIYSGDRMVAVVSLYGLECGWPQTPQRTPGCMKMITNIYVYAMTRGVEVGDSGR